MEKSENPKGEESVYMGRRLRIQFDIGYRGDQGKEMDPDGETVPDMALTVRQLLEDHTRGRTSGNVKIHEPLYFETEIPTLRDMTDVGKYRDMLNERLKDVNKFIEEERAEKEAKKAAKSKESKEGNKDHNEDPPTDKNGQTRIV